jgi:hypothetical protein
MVAHVRPPPSDPANRLFLRVMVWGLMARSTMLHPSSIRPSVRKRSKISRRAMASDGLGQLRLAGDARQGLLPEGEQFGNDGSRDGLPRSSTRRWVLAAHLGFDLPQLSHTLDRSGGDLTVSGGMEFIEAPSAVGPAFSKAWTIIAPVLADELVLSGIAVDLEDAAIAPKMPARTLARLAVLEAIGHHGRPLPPKVLSSRA